MCSPRKATASGVRLLCKCVSKRELGTGTQHQPVGAAASGVGVRSSNAPVALMGGTSLQGSSAARGKKGLYASMALVVSSTDHPQEKSSNGYSRHWVSSVIKDPRLSRHSQKPLTAMAGSVKDCRVPKPWGARAWPGPAAMPSEKSVTAGQGALDAGQGLIGTAQRAADWEWLQAVTSALQNELRHVCDEAIQLFQTLRKRVVEIEADREEAQRQAALQRVELEEGKARITEMEEAIFVLEDEVEQHRAVKLHDNLAISDLENYVEKLENQNRHLQHEMKIMQQKHQEEVLEWQGFQADLQTSVVVANRIRAQVEEELGILQQQLHEAQERNENLRRELEEARAQGSSRMDQVHSHTNVMQRDNARLHQVMGPVPSSSSSSSTVRALIRTFDLALQGPTQSVHTVAMAMPLSPRMTKSPPATVVSPVQSTCSGSPPRLELGTDRRLSKSASHRSIEDVKEAVHHSENSPPDPLKAQSPASCPCLTAPSPPVPSSAIEALGIPRKQARDPLRTLVKENGESKRNALLRWCQRKTQMYQNINIKNFSSSWKDGLALCAILHTYLPGSIPFQELNNQDKQRNLTLALQAAASVGIKCTLDIDEMVCVERPDWERVMGYISSVYEHFES